MPPGFTCARACAHRSLHSFTYSRSHGAMTEHLLFVGRCSGHRRGEGSTAWSFSLEVGSSYWSDNHTEEYFILGYGMCSERRG